MERMAKDTCSLEDTASNKGSGSNREARDCNFYNHCNFCRHIEYIRLQVVVGEVGGVEGVEQKGVLKLERI